MRPFRRSRSRMGRGRSKLRRTKWGVSYWTFAAQDLTPGNNLILVQWVKAPAAAVQSGSTPQFFEPEDETIVRWMPMFSAMVRDTTGGPTLFNAGGYIAAGLIKWTGVTDTPPSFLDVPWPIFDGDADWVWTCVDPLPGELPTLSGNAQKSSVYQDVRAMRKFSRSEGALLVVQYQNNSSVTMRFESGFYLRALIKQGQPA